MDIKTFKQTFDVFADEWVVKKLAEYPDLVIDEQVLGYIRHSGELIRGGGKRIRPYLCALMYEAMGKKTDNEVLFAGLALELFHTFALIHDDIIDRGDLRRNIPTMHRIVQEALKKFERIGDISHVANGEAMLVGDLVYLWVFETFFRVHIPEPQKSHAFGYLTRMINEVIVGEMIDVDITTRQTIDDALLYQKTLLKTATYTFVRPMQIGTILAGGEAHTVAFCEQFGRALGLAFQIQDDLFDLTLSADELHKRVLSDIEERQHTYFTQYIFTQGTDREKEKLLLYFGKTLAEKERGDAVALFESSGAITYGMKIMNDYFDEAAAIVQTAKIDDQLKKILQDLVIYIRERTV